MAAGGYLQRPPDALYEPLRRWIDEFVLLVRAALTMYTRRGGRVALTSWWRDIGDNARAGGHSHSQHLLGLALDVVPLAPGTPAQLAAAARAAGLVAIVEGDHVHLQKSPAGVWDRVVDAARALGYLT